MAMLIQISKILPTPNDISPMIDDIGADLVYRMKDQLKAEDKVWTGTARDSIDYDKTNTTVFSDLVYVYNIEFGRQRGAPAPPFAKIHTWVKSRLGLQDPEAYWAATNIRFAIKRDGIEETRFTKKAIIGLVNPSGMPIISHKKRKTKLTTRQKDLRRRLAADQRVMRSWKRQGRLQKKQLRQAQSTIKKKIAKHNKKVRKFKSRSKSVQKNVKKFGAFKSFTKSKGRKFGGKF